MRRQEVRAISENQDTRVPGRIDQKPYAGADGQFPLAFAVINFGNLKDHVARTD